MSNVIENRISTTLTAAEITSLSTARSSYATTLEPKTVALTADELKSLLGVDVDNAVFVDDAIRLTDAEGLAMLPPAIAALVPEMVKDETLGSQLDAEESWLQNMLTRVQHTKRLLSHEKYKVALAIYKQYETLA